MKTLLARFATSFPDALRGVTVFSAMLLLIVALEESAWAQAGRVRSGGGGVSDEVLMFARWAGLGC